MPIVPDHRKTLNASPPPAIAMTSMITAVTTSTRMAATPGVPARVVPASPVGGVPSRRMSRAKANASREAPTMQARQQPKALIAAPIVIRSPTQPAMYSRPRSPSSDPDAMNFCTPATGLAGTSKAGTPAAAALLVVVMMGVIMLIEAIAGGGEAFNVFLWAGTIGTLILLVAYVLTTIGAIKLVFVERRMPSVPMWQVIIPIAALVVLGYTLYRNVVPFPSPDDGALFWNPIVAGIWIVVCIVAVLAAGGAARRAGAALTAAELGARQDEVGAR